MTDALDELSVEQLRRRRDEVRERQESLSYRRRLLHAQLDIVQAAAEADDAEELAFALRRVLSDPPSTGGPARSVDVSGRTDDGGLEPLPEDLVEMDDDERATLLKRLRDDERETSQRRRQLLDELDRLQEELVARYRDQGVDTDVLLGGGES